MTRSWRILLFLLAIVYVLIGCRPRNVLSPEKMQDVLYDLHRADGAIQVAGYNYLHDQEVAGYYKNVLDKHGINQAQFDSSLVWYTDNPQRFIRIYPEVIKRLEEDVENEKEKLAEHRKRMLEKRQN